MDQVAVIDEKKSGSILDDVMGALQKGLTKIRETDWKAITSNPSFIPAVLALVGLGLMFWQLIIKTGMLWYSDDYYSHGALVPVLIAWQLNRRKDLFAKAEIKPGKGALFVIPFLLFLQFVGFTGDFWFLQSLTFVGSLITAVWLIFGAKWARIVAIPFAFMLFALPVWDNVVNNYTNPLQLLSTTVAEKLLSLFGFSPMRLQPTEIQLNSFTLNVAIPCSGLKLLVAVACFTTHFVMIARNSLSFNLLMFAMVIPLCLFINGLRIALIGVVGDQFGSAAGMQFHDYSGYITLLLCFYILFKFARLFGWKE